MDTNCVFEFCVYLNQCLIVPVMCILQNGNGRNGQKGRRDAVIARRTYEQLMYLAEVYQPYTFYNARFETSNLQKLYLSLSNEERQNFWFNMEEVDWQQYVRDVHIPGLRKYVLKGRQ